LGGLLAQEFASEYPQLVDRIFFIGYPLDNKSNHFMRKMKKALSHRSKNRLHLKGLDGVNSLLGNSLFYLLFFLPSSKRMSVKKYFSVPGRVKANLFERVISYNNLDLIKKLHVPVTFINGDKDPNNNHISEEFQTVSNSYILKNMRHNFDGYESQIVDIIKKHLSGSI
jgi:pimeloyl-ACP methyl ester carboxylesterase